MEKREVNLIALIFAGAALAVIVCMFLNWMPVELNLGSVQINDVFGNVNALNLFTKFGDLEESVGEWSSLLPEEFEKGKMLSVLVAISAGLTILAYVSSVVLRFMGKERYVEVLSWLAGVGAIITHTGFCSVIEGIADYIGLSAGGYDVLNIVRHSPCTAVLISGIIAICCTQTVTDIIAGLIDSMISAMANLFMLMGEIVKLIINNFGYIVSDVIGGVIGIYVGALVNGAMDSVILAVIVGLATAGLVAYIIMKIVDMVFAKRVSSV